MIWFDIKELERGLKNGDVSDKEAYNYLLATLIMFSIVPYIASNDYESKWLIALEIIATITITVIGTKMTFNINSAGDNKDFFKRFLSLSFVAGIRLVVFVMIVAIPLGIIMYFLEKGAGTNQNIKDSLYVGLVAISGVFYYYMLTNSFKRVSN